MKGVGLEVEGVHEVADYLPLMSDEEFKAFKADIEQNGLQVPIVVYRKAGRKFVIIDGRHRQRACQELGITPTYTVFQGKKEELLSHVLSLNVGRRHLSESQRAAVAVDLLSYFKAEASSRQRGGRGGVKLSAKLRGASAGIKGKASEQAAKMMNVSPRLVESARRLKGLNPELFGAVKAGRVKVSRALLEAQRSGAGGEGRGETEEMKLLVIAKGAQAESLRDIAEGQVKDVQLSRKGGTRPIFTVTEVYEFGKNPATKSPSKSKP